MKKLARGILKNIKFTVVDNYQGEENDIVLISFVRSNDDGNIGFLKTSNRICVALSRAKKGLYCIGNFELLAEKSEIWKSILNSLKSNSIVGNSLELFCQTHPETKSYVSCDKDFELVKDGGCSKKCEYRLSCGHKCHKYCHSYDQDHEEILCLRPCEKKCDEGHPCQKICSEDCGLCFTPVPKFIENCKHEITVECHLRNMDTDCTKICLKMLPCNHETMAYCYQKEEDIRCLQPCSRLLLCGHNCFNLCGDKCESKCKVLCEFISDICGHLIKGKCYLSEDAEYLMENCTSVCNYVLSCGHRCRGTCKSCYQGRLHLQCNKKCDKILVCGHMCTSICSKSCPPCKLPCENLCNHKKCSKICGDSCECCDKLCTWICPHKQCSRLCGDRCDRGPCDEPCPIVLKCNHPCLGFCGEPCPTICHICSEGEEKESNMPCKEIIQDRYVLLEDCNHSFKVNNIEQWIKNEVKNLGMKTCPTCGKVIRRSFRFQEYIKLFLENVENVKKVLKKFHKKVHNLPLPLPPTNIKMTVHWPVFIALSSKKRKSAQELIIMRNFIEMIKSVVFLINHSEVHYAEIDYNADYINKTLSWIIPVLLNDYLNASDQRIFDLKWEIHRLGVVKNVNILSLPIKDQLKLLYYPFRSSDLKRYLSEIQSGHFYYKLMPSLPRVGVSLKDWHRCDKGHVFYVSPIKIIKNTSCSKC